MNRKRFFALCVTLLVLATAGSALACTVTAIGKKTTVDGSVMTATPATAGTTTASRSSRASPSPTGP